jgi:hypothetical protein
MPHLEGLLGGPLVLETVARLAGSAGDGLVLRAVDACLGIPGLPQSATGQTSLFTGVNAAALLGEHVTAHPTTRLRQVIAEHSLLKSAAEAGRSVFFANAHSEQFWQMIREGKRRLAASTLTAMAAGLQIPTLDDLARGRALLWDITHEIATTHLGYQLPLLEAGKAGARLAHLAAEFDLLLFESFLPDLAGPPAHRARMGFVSPGRLSGRTAGPPLAAHDPGAVQRPRQPGGHDDQDAHLPTPCPSWPSDRGPGTFAGPGTDITDLAAGHPGAAVRGSRRRNIMTDLQAVADLLLESSTLKRMPRTGWAMRGVPDVESVADHSFGIAFLALAMADILRRRRAEAHVLDLEKVLIMALLHDLAEARLTDLPASAVRLIPEEIKSRAESGPWPTCWRLCRAPGACRHCGRVRGSHQPGGPAGARRGQAGDDDPVPALRAGGQPRPGRVLGGHGQARLEFRPVRRTVQPTACAPAVRRRRPAVRGPR